MKWVGVRHTGHVRSACAGSRQADASVRAVLPGACRQQPALQQAAGSRQQPALQKVHAAFQDA
jgi:hypothetical protein